MVGFRGLLSGNSLNNSCLVISFNVSDTGRQHIYSSLNLKDKKDFFEKLNFNLYFMLDSIFIMHIMAEFKGYMETGKS